MVVEAALAGVSVLSLCERGDDFIMKESGKIFKKEKEMKKGRLFCFSGCTCIELSSNSNISPRLPGIAFPTCVSVNNCVCHHSPLKSDPDVVLKDGDLVKV